MLRHWAGARARFKVETNEQSSIMGLLARATSGSKGAGGGELRLIKLSSGAGHAPTTAPGAGRAN